MRGDPVSRSDSAAASEKTPKLTTQFDTDGNGWLKPQRRAAREYIETTGVGRGRGQGAAGVPYRRSPGPASRRPPCSSPPGTDLYDERHLRTLFLDFENADWERELMTFKSTDIQVPARLTVDGHTYRDVGVQFHGNSSFSQVPMG